MTLEQRIFDSLSGSASGKNPPRWEFRILAYGSDGPLRGNELAVPFLYRLQATSQVGNHKTG